MTEAAKYKRYANPTGRYCACGNPALKRKCGNYVCARCDRLEQGYEREHNTRSYIRHHPNRAERELEAA